MPEPGRTPQLPVTFYGRRFDLARCRDECARALAVAAELRAAHPEIRGWINFPIVNESGRADEVGLAPSASDGRYTAYAPQFPYCAEIVASFRRAALTVTYARVAVLLERDVLRPHTDLFESLRLLIPFNRCGDDFRHIMLSECFAMRTGELWSIDGRLCHGAANVGARAQRVVLLIDADPSSPRAGLGRGVPLPADHRCRRKRWTSCVRRAMFARLAPLVESRSFEEIERELLLIPFLYDIDAGSVYGEILAFCRFAADHTAAPELRERYAAQARELVAPSLSFQIPARAVSP